MADTDVPSHLRWRARGLLVTRRDRDQERPDERARGGRRRQPASCRLRADFRTPCPAGLCTPAVRYLEFLVATYGAETVGKWMEPPVSFDEWRLGANGGPRGSGHPA